MTILGLDSATWTASVGIVVDGRTVAERSEREQRSHASSLPVMVECVLADASLTVTDIDALAVSIGPGSFTGLRIGLGLAKGIAFAGGARLVTVPTLEALAWAADAPAGATVCAALDARKHEVYAAMFRVNDDGEPTRVSADEALSPEALADRLPDGATLVGDAAEVYGELLGGRTVIRPFATHHPRGGIVARLGWRRCLAGETVNPGAAEPVYVRAPEAEITRGRSR